MIPITLSCTRTATEFTVLPEISSTSEKIKITLSKPHTPVRNTTLSSSAKDHLTSKDFRRYFEQLDRSPTDIGSAEKDLQRIRLEAKRVNNQELLPVTPTHSKDEKRIYTVYRRIQPDGINRIIPVRGPNVIGLSRSEKLILIKEHLEQHARAQSHLFRGGLAELSIFSGAEARPPLAEKESPP